MPRQNQTRTIGSEAALAARIAFEREQRGMNYAALATAMTDAGCSVDKSAIHRIEKGTPRRKVSVDELVALMAVFDLSFDELMTPVELIKQQRAREIAEKIPGAFDAFEDAVMAGLQIYLDYGRLAAEDPELLEYMNNHAFAGMDRKDASSRVGVDLGDKVTEEEISNLQGGVVRLWADVLQLASKAAGATS